MCVLDPVKIVINNFEQYISESVQSMTAACHPNNAAMGDRTLPFTRELYIDRADFSEDTSLSRKKFKRLVMGEYVRLRSAYVIKAEAVTKNSDGSIDFISASLVPNTVGDNPPEGIKPRGVIHWVSASEGEQAEIRLYKRLFDHESPDGGDGEVTDHLTPDSMTVLNDCWIEPGLAYASPETTFQFEREGYFVADRWEHSSTRPVFNLTIGLRDSK